jgi:predicted ATP-dependent endonuclease of OLD family
MGFADFSFKNFKGINKMKLELTESPDSKIYALVGLNESGKTSLTVYINHQLPPLFCPIHARIGHDLYYSIGH